MPILFSCPYCGVESTVDEAYAGQSGPCKACGKTITIPVAGARPQMGAPPPAKSSSVPILIIVLVVGGVVALGCIGVLTALLLPAVQAAREAARRTQCTNNLKQISIAMMNYHDTYGSLPPAYIEDEDGRPMHSWRTLILPFLEQDAIYEQYDFNKPWDSPENLAVTSQPVSVYSCPSSTANQTSETSYMVVTGPGTLFEGQKGCRFREVTDGLSNTLLIVEVRNSGVGWAEPRDIPAANLTMSINTGEASGPGSYHPGGMNVALADGSVKFLSESTPPETLQALSTRAGGEIAPDF